MGIENISNDAFNIFKTLVDQYEDPSNDKKDSVLIPGSLIKELFSEYEKSNLKLRIDNLPIDNLTIGTSQGININLKNLFSKNIVELINQEPETFSTICFREKSGDSNSINIKKLINDVGELVALLGRNYIFHNRKEDTARGIEYLEYAADHGILSAQESLIDYYHDDKYGTKDDVKMFKYLKLAADQNNYSAVWDLGLCYESGRGVEKNYEKALECYQKLADNKSVFSYNGSVVDGKIQGMFKLANYYESGKGVKKDLKIAFDYLLKCAKSSSPFSYDESLESQFKLAIYIEKYFMWNKSPDLEDNEENRAMLQSDARLWYDESEDYLSAERKEELRDSTLDAFTEFEFKLK